MYLKFEFKPSREISVIDIISGLKTSTVTRLGLYFEITTNKIHLMFRRYDAIVGCLLILARNLIFLPLLLLYSI